jgi:hypothetical protein
MSHRCYLLSLALVALLLPASCTLVPHKFEVPQYHNPWPQLERVAIAPFYNLSENPTVNQDLFAEAYYAELQGIPGFEVVPVGVTRRAMQMYNIAGETPQDFQRLAQAMGVDAIVVGSVNDYAPYYPPRMSLSVRWYAANPCFHPMPSGYGLPWGRAEEEYIPDRLVDASEFELAKAQLATQTPTPPPGLNSSERTGVHATTASASDAERLAIRSTQAPAPPSTHAQAEPVPDLFGPDPEPTIGSPPVSESPIAPGAPPELLGAGGMPQNWPDPSGFFPATPQAVCPQCMPYCGPILSQTRSYNGADSELTTALAGYYDLRDEARFGGWQAYLQRSEDFIRFCCYMHITEMLAARGAARETKVVYRSQVGRYHP